MNGARFGMPDFLRNLDFSHLSRQSIDYGIKFGMALLILLIGLWLAARVANFGRRALARASLDDTLVGFLRNVIYGILIAMVVVAALQQAGVPSASLFAAMGAAGLAIGLALQGSLSNLAWGVLLIATKPFKVGDFVEIGGVLGTVNQVGLMQTWLVLPDNREACMPNSKVGSGAIINYNRRGTRRFEVTVGIAYGDDIGKAMDAIRAQFGKDERVLKDPEPGIWATELADSSVNLVVRGWTSSADYWATQTDFVRIVKESLDAAGISIPFPQREVLVRQDNAGSQGT
ncbi:MAG: mechanosensitive ion channel domain-containing protein [Rhodanobacteraceae bacterium]